MVLLSSRPSASDRPPVRGPEDTTTALDTTAATATPPSGPVSPLPGAQMAYLNHKNSKSSATLSKLKGIFNSKKLATNPGVAAASGPSAGGGNTNGHPHPLQRVHASSNSSSSSSLASSAASSGESSPNTPVLPVHSSNPSASHPMTIPTLMLASGSTNNNTNISSAMLAAGETIPPTTIPASVQQSIINGRSSNVVSPTPSLNSIKGPAGRFILFGDEAHPDHVHHLKSTRRQEKLGGMIRDILGTGKKVRDDAVSAVPDFVYNNNNNNSGKTTTALRGVKEKKTPPQQSSPVLSDDESGKFTPTSINGGLDQHHLSLMSGLVSQIQKGEKEVTSVVRNGSAACKDNNASLLQKYGKCQEVIGKGAYGVVRVSQKYDRETRCDRLFAIKEFKRRTTESEANFSKRLTSEFCISSSLHHPNIIQTLDLMKDAKGEYCEVMEFCAGGDLYSLILSSSGGLEQIEADCFFKQIIRGVVYMHDMGVAHCDLKPENILLSTNGAVKISDFGNGECFRMAWEKEIHLSTGICGSTPYIAPEEFRDKCFDPRAVDIWATGVIYMAMRTGSYLWKIAKPDEDMYYSKYLDGRKHKDGFAPIENLPRAKCRNVIYSILDPQPKRRITAKQVLNSEWGRAIKVCEGGEGDEVGT